MHEWSADISCRDARELFRLSHTHTFELLSQCPPLASLRELQGIWQHEPFDCSLNALIYTEVELCAGEGGDGGTGKDVWW